MLHSFLGILRLHVSDESVSLGSVCLLILHELDGVDAAEGFKDPLEHLVADVAVEVSHVELHGPLLRPDHGVRVVTHSVLLCLARLHNYRDTQQLLAWNNIGDIEKSAAYDIFCIVIYLTGRVQEELTPSL